MNNTNSSPNQKYCLDIIALIISIIAFFTCSSCFALGIAGFVLALIVILDNNGRYNKALGYISLALSVLSIICMLFFSVIFIVSDNSSNKDNPAEATTTTTTETMTTETTTTTTTETITTITTTTTKQDNRKQKNGFENNTNTTVQVAHYSFSIPEYWVSDQNDTNNYRAYAETNGKSAMFQIQIKEDKDDPVDFEILDKETKNGSMQKSFKSWFSSCDEITTEEITNCSGIKGFIYSTHGVASGMECYSENFVFPSEIDNSWAFISLMQTNNTDYSYTEDFRRIIDSIEFKESLETTTTTTIIATTTQPTTTTTAAPSSKYELAYERAFDDYSLFYLIDKDENVCISFLSDGYGYYGTYTGDTSSSITVTYPYEGYSDYITFSNDGYIANVTIGNDIKSFEYKKVSVKSAEKYLKKIYMD